MNTDIYLYSLSENAALREAMAEFRIACCTIVTHNEEEKIEIELPMPRSPALDSVAGRSCRP